MAIFENQDRIPITPGLLLMAAYIQFIFPKESKVTDYRAYNLDVSIFKINKWEKDKIDNDLGSAAIFRRIRNAISHANVDFADGESLYLIDGPLPMVTQLPKSFV